MQDQDKKDKDEQKLSDEELDEVAGGISHSRSERQRLRKFLANGGTMEEWRRRNNDHPWA